MNNSRIDTFANRLSTAMQLNNINQVELSEKTKSYPKNISQSLINKYLKGKALARQDNLYILCKILDVDEAWMMGFDVPIERTPDNERKEEIIEYIATDSSMSPVFDVGDIAYVQKTNKYKSGQTILFKLENTEYIRKIIENNNIIEFHAINAYYPILKFTEKELKIKKFQLIGRVIKVENTSAFK